MKTNTWLFVLFGAGYAGKLIPVPSFWTLSLLSHSPRRAEGGFNPFHWLLFIYATLASNLHSATTTNNYFFAQLEIVLGKFLVPWLLLVFNSGSLHLPCCLPSLFWESRHLAKMAWQVTWGKLWLCKVSGHWDLWHFLF